MRWTILCRVVDNFGDIGFAWRLAADLAGRGEHVRFVVDDPSLLGWMAPGGAERVVVEVADGGFDAGAAATDVIVETFGCRLPATERDLLDRRAVQPLRLNVEHLTAEPFALRSHGLPSPHFLADGRAVPTWFYYPGFDERSGGLLREPGLLEARAGFEREAWLAGLGVQRQAGERVVVVFGYPRPALAGYPRPALAPWLDAFAAEPTLLLLAPGELTDQLHAGILDGRPRERLHSVALPFLSQPAFDRLLWSADLAFVRGEDSPVRAIWAGVPFVWQLYAQHDGAHLRKLQAFLDVYLDGAPAAVDAAVRSVFAAWNGGLAPDGAAFAAAELEAWRVHAIRRRDAFAAQPDLTTRLIAFASAER